MPDFKRDVPAVASIPLFCLLITNYQTTMKKQKTVTIYDHDKALRAPPSDLVGYIAWLQAKLDEIPEGFRPSARTDIYGSEEYGSGVLCYTIEYDRPETDEEEAARENADRVKADAVRQKELATLEALRAKYESGQSDELCGGGPEGGSNAR